MVRRSRHARETFMSAVLSKSSVYDTLTAKVIAALEAGAGDYQTPWHAPGICQAFPTNASTLAEYRGINILGLWLEGMQRGYPSNLWASYLQWKTLGALVRKGARGSMVVFYKRIEEKASEPDDHDKDPKLRHFARASYVFNVAQVDGYH